MRRRDVYRDSISARGPMATMRPLTTAMAPSSITRRVWSIVMMVPPVTSRSAGCLRVWVVAFETIVVKIRETQMNAELNGFMSLFQESGIEGTRQKIGHVKLFALAVQICEDDRRAARKLPDDLTAGAARRS